MRRLAIALALVLACSAPPATSSPTTALLTATPSPTTSPSPSPSEKPRDLVTVAAGDLSGEHALVAQVSNVASPDSPGVMHFWDVSLDGTAPRELVTYHRGDRHITDADEFVLAQQLSPDGRKLVVADAQDVAGTGLFVIDLITGTATVIKTNGGADHAAWSPDGTRIGFRGYTVGYPFNVETGFFAADAIGGSPEELWKSDLQPGTGTTRMFGWTGDGSAIAIGRNSTDVSLIDIASRSIATIFTGQFGGLAVRAKRPSAAVAVSDIKTPSATPRGAPGSIGTTGRLEVRDTVWTTPYVAFRHGDVGTLLYDPRWNPQSDEVLLHWVCGAGAAERDELVIVDAVKSSARTLPVSSCVRSAEWNANGTKILYTSLDTVRVRNADGSNDREIFHASVPAGATQAFIFGARSLAPRP